MARRDEGLLRERLRVMAGRSGGEVSGNSSTPVSEGGKAELEALDQELESQRAQPITLETKSVTAPVRNVPNEEVARTSTPSSITSPAPPLEEPKQTKSSWFTKPSILLEDAQRGGPTPPTREQPVMEAPSPYEARRKIVGETYRMMRDTDRASDGAMKAVGDQDYGVFSFGRHWEKAKDVAGQILDDATSAIAGKSKMEAGALDGALKDGDLLAAQQQAIEFAKMQNPSSEAAMRDYYMRHAKVLGDFADYYRSHGITDGKQMAELMRDAAKEYVWAERDDTKTRMLSDGRLVLNPRLVAEKDGTAAFGAIDGSPASDAEKAQAKEKLNASRNLFAKDMHEKLLAKGEGDYAAHVKKMQAQGKTAPAEVLYSWDGLDRNWYVKNWSANIDATRDGARGIMNTIDGADILLDTGLGKAGEALGLDGMKRWADGNIAKTARQIHERQQEGEYDHALAELRDENSGARGFGKDLTSSTIQLLPMLLGGGGGQAIGKGAAQGSARAVMGKIASQVGVYGWAGLQGYGSMMESAVAQAEAKAHAEKRQLTDEERTKAIANAQGAALANGFQTAILSKLLGGGVEQTALGTTAAGTSLTARETLTRLSLQGGKNIRTALSELKPELTALAKTIGHGAKDETIEEGLNQAIEGIIKRASTEPDKKMSEVIGDVFRSMGVAAPMGGAFPLGRGMFEKNTRRMQGEALAAGDAARNGGEHTRAAPSEGANGLAKRFAEDWGGAPVAADNAPAEAPPISAANNGTAENKESAAPSVTSPAAPVAEGDNSPHDPASAVPPTPEPSIVEEGESIGTGPSSPPSIDPAGTHPVANEAPRSVAPEQEINPDHADADMADPVQDGNPVSSHASIEGQTPQPPQERRLQNLRNTLGELRAFMDRGGHSVDRMAALEAQEKALVEQEAVVQQQITQAQAAPPRALVNLGKHLDGIGALLENPELPPERRRSLEKARQFYTERAEEISPGFRARWEGVVPEGTAPDANSGDTVPFAPRTGDSASALGSTRSGVVTSPHGIDATWNGTPPTPFEHDTPSPPVSDSSAPPIAPALTQMSPLDAPPSLSTELNIIEEGPKSGPGAASIYDENFAANRYYEPSQKHGGSTYYIKGKIVNPEPTNGQESLNFSFLLSENSTRRIGVDPDTNEIVIFDRTEHALRNGEIIGGIYHGHIRNHKELLQPMKNALHKNGITIRKDGSISLDRNMWKE